MMHTMQSQQDIDFPHYFSPIIPEQPSTVLDGIARWVEARALRQLDRALAEWFNAHSAEHSTSHPVAHSAALLAIALLAHAEGQGHTSLALPPDGDAIAWPAAQRQELEYALHTISAALRQNAPALADAPPAFVWAAALALSPQVQTLHARGQKIPFTFNQLTENSPSSIRPFVLACGAQSALLSLRRYWQHEQRIAQFILSGDDATQAIENKPFISSPAAKQHARLWLDDLFAPSDLAQPNWQKIACALALRGRLTIITGGPGTGKTYTAARLLTLLLATHPAPAHMRIALAAPTGKAAARLKQSIDQALTALLPQLCERPLGFPADRENPVYLQDIAPNIPSARTLHALLGVYPGQGQPRHHAGNPLALDVLIVDEASMIHAEMMAALLAALPPTARLVVLGDKDQLESVEAGAVLGELCQHAERGQYSQDTAEFIAQVSGEHIPENLIWKQSTTAAPPLAQHTAMLRHSHRFHGPIAELAQAVHAGHPEAAHAAFERAQACDAPSSIAHLPATTPALAVRLALGQWDKTAWERHLNHPKNNQKNNEFNADIPATWQPYLAALAQWPQVLQTAHIGHSQHLRTHAQWVREVLTAFAQLRLLCVTRQGLWGVENIAQMAEVAIQDCLKNPEKSIIYGQNIPQKIFPAAALVPTQWWPGRAVMVTRNEPLLGVFNGDIGIALPAPRSAEDCAALADNPRAKLAAMPALRVYFDLEAPSGSAQNVMENNAIAAPLNIATARLPHVQSAFAMTVHKSQGSEFAHTLLVLPPAAAARALLTRELLYTGITRAKRHFTLLSAEAQSLNLAIARPSQRSSALAGFLSHGWEC